MNIRDYIGEGTEYDKKEALEVKHPKSWLKSVSAFANGKGGVLLFGVSDDDIPVGLKDAEGDAEIISEAVMTRMEPVPDIGLSIRRAIVDGEYRKFIVLHVYSGEETPYYYTGEGLHTAFIRRENPTRENPTRAYPARENPTREKFLLSNQLYPVITVRGALPARVYL